MMSKSDPIFIKLGGSLITDKTQPETPRPDVIARLAREVRQVHDARPDWPLLLGHGSGSFGHWLGGRYGTRDGVQGHRDWVGYAHVAATAARLNRLVTDAFLDAGVPVLSTQPSASARCRDGVLMHLDVGPIRRALGEGLAPLVYGDVALDTVRGGTIISTEEILAYLCGVLRPGRILLLGRTAGVYGPDGAVIPCITPHNVAALADSLGGAQGMDVTGGMDSKVHQMLALVQRWPGLTVRIVSGMEPGLLTQVLLDPACAAGTHITGRVFVG
jgi:isopentenyl phosphate kinase